MTGLLGGLAVAAAVALVVWMIARRSRQRRLAALVAAWGKPVERERDVAELAAELELGATGGRGVGLDERTLHDLNLDDVFAVIDRTGSRIGQLALYARLRSPDAPANLLPFDALPRGSSRTPCRDSARSCCSADCSIRERPTSGA